MKIETLEVAGMLTAVQGARNPMNSWDKSDSGYCKDYGFEIGEKDLDLCQRLIRAGGEHSKFMRQIQVWVNIDMPRYFWSEFDTYHFNTKNSCSTMHRLLHKTTSITKDLFVYDKEDEDVIEVIIKRLNEIRVKYLETKDVKLIRRAKQLLSEGFLQLRTVNTNYAEIRNIWLQRVYHPHKLKEEWVEHFGNWVKSLPYSGELIMLGVDK